MARYKLKEYLDDPSLLRTISEEEMREWAAEVPYAGLVQRLLAQKLAMESASQEEQEKANVLAVLSNVNPHQTIQSIEDFKELMLTGPPKEEENIKSEEQDEWDEAFEMEFGDSTKHSSESAKNEENTIEEIINEELDEVIEISEISSFNEDEFTGNLESDLHQSEVHSPGEYSDEEQAPQAKSDLSAISAETTNEVISESIRSTDQDNSEFSAWLESLQSLESDDSKEDPDIELADKELASDALARLLVQQGHVDRAIAMYEVLMLKNPQKSSFFAAQIEKLKRS